jgi:hypothetical protein
MRNELIRLELWTDIVIGNKERRWDSSDDFGSMVRSELSQILESFESAVYGNQKDESLHRYFLKHQQMLQVLSKKLTLSIQHGEERNVLIDAVNLLNLALEKSYSEYIDPHFPSSLIITSEMKAFEEAKIEGIKQCLFDCKIDDALQQIILGSLKSLTENTECPFTISEMNFYRALILLFENFTNGDDKILSEALIRINFNNILFFNYCKLKIKELLIPKATIPEELCVLEKLQHYFGHVKVPKTSVYDAQQISISVMISDWLKVFIKLKEREMSGGYHEGSETSAKHIDSKKVITTLSIGELGLIARLFIMAAVFRTTNKRGLARFMSKNFATQYKHVNEPADENHLYAAMLNSSESIMDTVQAILNRMLKKLQAVRMELKGKNKNKD